MNTIKVKVDGDNFSCDSCCFICLQSVSNKDRLNSLNFLLNYLKVKDKVKLVVCEKCGNHLIKFERLSNILEKVRLEMDYLLGLFQSEILNSKRFKPASAGFNSVRECVRKKCKEKIVSPMVEIRLRRFDHPKSERYPDYFDDVLPNWDDNDLQDNEMPSSSKHSFEDSTASVITDVENIKNENLEGAVPIATRKGKLSTSKKTTKCPKCSKTFCDKYYLKLHNAIVHLNLKLFKCSACLQSFSTKVKLNSHINTVHPTLNNISSKPKRKCTTCSKTFDNKIQLKRHINEVHLIRDKWSGSTPKNQTSRMFACGKCKKSFVTLKSLKWHLRRVHTEDRFQCEICDKSYKYPAYLKLHVSSVHEKLRHQCQAPNCDKEYSNPGTLRDHYMLEHPDFTVPPKPLPSNTDYTVLTENEETVVECNLCPKQFKTVIAIKEHIKRVHGPKILLCSDCGYTTSNRSNLNQHIRHSHKKDIVMVECEFCKKLVNSLTLGMHIQNVHGPKKLVCEVCGYATANKTNLDVHIHRKHKVKSTVECEFCKKQINSTYLYRHIRRAHGKKKD